MPRPAGERLARLSHRVAVRAAALTGGDPDHLASLLYRAGGRPPDPRCDPRWAQVLVHRAEQPVRRELVAYDRTSTAAWLGRTRTGADPAELVHKVYVSPAVEALADALPLVVATATALQVPAWKVGADLAGLHRPDKVVLYLASEAAADDAAGTLARVLDGLAAHGVPFTGQVGGSGIVSRGRDDDGTSWRMTVSRALAGALHEARTDLGPRAGAPAVAALAYDRLRAGGLDVDTWHPSRRPVTAGVSR